MDGGSIVIELEKRPRVISAGISWPRGLRGLGPLEMGAGSTWRISWWRLCPRATCSPWLKTWRGPQVWAYTTW